MKQTSLKVQPGQEQYQIYVPDLVLNNIASLFPILKHLGKAESASRKYKIPHRTKKKITMKNSLHYLRNTISDKSVSPR